MHFYIMARDSAFETQNQLIYGLRISYFLYDAVKKMELQYSGLIYDINKIIKTLSI